MMIENENSYDIIGLINFLRKSSLLIIGIAFGLSVMVYLALLTIEDYYTSSARLTIVEEQSAPSGSNNDFLGSIGGGLSLGSSSLNDQVIQIQELIGSRDFLRRILSKPGIYEKVVYAKSYDQQSGKIRFDENYDENPNEVNKDRLLPMDLKFFIGFSEFKNNFDFIMNLDSDYYSISYSHVSPKFSQEILSVIIQELNFLQRQNDIEEANSALNYLENEILNARNAEVKGSISKLIENQLKIKMIANMRSDYAVKVIDSPYQPVVKTGPLRALATMMTFFVSIFIMLPIFTFIFSRSKIA